MDSMGRKSTALISTALFTVFLFLYSGLNKLYGTSDNLSGVYATIAMIFLFQGAFYFAWSPLVVLYPPEVLNYSMRSNGMAACTFASSTLGYVDVMTFH